MADYENYRSLRIPDILLKSPRIPLAILALRPAELPPPPPAIVLSFNINK